MTMMSAATIHVQIIELVIGKPADLKKHRRRLSRNVAFCRCRISRCLWVAPR